MDISNLVMPLPFYCVATLNAVDTQTTKRITKFRLFLQIICLPLCVVKQNHNIKILSNDVDQKCQIFRQFNKYIMTMNGKPFNVRVKYV